jgi:hypothetical protein
LAVSTVAIMDIDQFPNRGRESVGHSVHTMQ